MSDIIEKLLEYVEDIKDKHSFTDNDYLTACNVLKNSYEIIKLKQNSDIKDIKDLNIKIFGKSHHDPENAWFELLHIKHKYRVSSGKSYISYKYGLQPDNTMRFEDKKQMIEFIVSSIILHCNVFRVEFNNIQAEYEFKNFYEKMGNHPYDDNYDDYVECGTERKNEILNEWKKYLVNVIEPLCTYPE